MKKAVKFHSGSQFPLFVCVYKYGPLSRSAEQRSSHRYFIYKDLVGPGSVQLHMSKTVTGQGFPNKRLLHNSVAINVLYICTKSSHAKPFPFQIQNKEFPEKYLYNFVINFINPTSIVLFCLDLDLVLLDSK